MYITWHGNSCFRITGKSGLDEIAICTDPYNEHTGLKPSRAGADIVTLNNTESGELDAGTIPGTPFIVKSAGEYEIKKVYIEGLRAFRDNNGGKDRGLTTIYQIHFEDLTLVHLGYLGGEVTQELLERIEGADVLFIPIGGNGVLNSKEAVELVSEIEPMVVVPMMYRIPGLKMPQDNLDVFAKEMGVMAEDAVSKLKLSKKDVQEGELKTIILEKS